MKRYPPWLTLLILAPALGEIVSGHQPLRELLNPLSVLILMLPYGFGALVTRELLRRWKKGWPSMLLLGAAYGLYEEAIVVRSIFNPGWAELNVLAHYSHVGGVTWTYAEMLIHFHVLISISASIYMAEMLHPAARDRPWMSDTGLVICIIGLLLWMPAGLLMTAFVPPLPGYILSWTAILTLIFCAYLAPVQFPCRRNHKLPRPRYFLTLGLVNMTVFFTIVYGVPESGILPLPMSVVLLLFLDAFTLWLLLRWSGNGNVWDDRHRLAWLSGGIGFFILFGMASDLKDFTGKSIVGFIFLVISSIIGIKLRWHYGRISEKS